MLQFTFNTLGIVGTITIVPSDSNNEYTAFIVKTEPDNCVHTNKPGNTSTSSENEEGCTEPDNYIQTNKSANTCTNSENEEGCTDPDCNHKLKKGKLSYWSSKVSLSVLRSYIYSQLVFEILTVQTIQFYFLAFIDMSQDWLNESDG